MGSRSLFILDVNDRTVIGLMCEVGKRSLTPLFSCHVELGPDENYPEAIESVISRCGAEGGRCFLSLPASSFYFRNVNVPFSDEKKIDEILGYELLDQVSFGGESFLCDTSVTDTDGKQTQLLATLIKENELDSWLQTVVDYGLEPELVTVSGMSRLLEMIDSASNMENPFVYVDVGRNESVFFFVMDKKIHTIRSLSGFTEDSEQELVDEIRRTMLVAGLSSMGMERTDDPKLILGGAAASQFLSCKHLKELSEVFKISAVETDAGAIPGDPVLQTLPKHLHPRLSGLLAIHTSDQRLINVIKSKTGGVTDFRLVKRFAPVVAVLLIILIIGAGYQIFDYNRMATERSALVYQAEQIYEQTLGGKKPVRDPVLELKAQIMDIDQSVVASIVHNPEVKAVAILSDISRRMPAAVKVSFKRFSFDRKKVKIDGMTGTYNDVDKIKKSLENSLYYSGVSIDSAGSTDGGGVKFAMTLLL